MDIHSEAEWDGTLNDFNGQDLTAVAQHGGAFDWLHNEPDLYTEDDDEPV